MEKQRLISKRGIWYGTHRKNGPTTIAFTGALAFRIHDKLIFSINPNGSMIFWERCKLVVLNNGKEVYGH